MLWFKILIFTANKFYLKMRTIIEEKIVPSVFFIFCNFEMR